MTPAVPDHELLRCIGRGSYGEVWLARSALGTLRAVKIVHRASFDHEQPFEREFKGIQKFEPVSRSHEGLVDVLQVGRNDGAGYFYYVMELADDANVAADVRRLTSTGARVSPPAAASDARDASEISHRSIPDESAAAVPDRGSPDPQRVRMEDGSGESTRARSFVAAAAEDSRAPKSEPPHVGCYEPRTLRSDLKRLGRLPVTECVRLGLSLADALAHLHRQSLVHRDIKPSNIIFVDGRPKLADIGLVADISEARSFVGTTGFIPPEGPGTAQADLYSLGKVLYEISTGHDRQDFPALPPNLRELPDADALIEFNEIVVKACAADPRQRYQSAQAMAVDLALLQAGKSVRRKRSINRLVFAARNAFLVGTVLATVLWAIPRFSNTRGAAPYTPKLSASAEANDFYHRGFHLYQKEGRTSLHQAIHYFRQAVEIDPQFALAHAMLGTAHCLTTDNPDWDLDKARRHAEIALALDDNLAEAHEVLAWVMFKQDWKWSDSEKEFKHAIALAPKGATLHEWYGVYLVEMGRFDNAITELKEAQKLDPLSLRTRTFLATTYSDSFRDDLALAEFGKVIDLETNSPCLAYVNLATLHEFRGELEKAIEMNHRHDVLVGKNLDQVSRRYDELRNALTNGGPAGYWQAKLAWAKANYDPFSLACVYAQSGDKDNAIASLETAFAQHSYNLGSYVMMTRALDNVRSDPRFEALLRKMKLR